MTQRSENESRCVVVVVVVVVVEFKNDTNGNTQLDAAAPSS